MDQFGPAPCRLSHMVMDGKTPVLWRTKTEAAYYLVREMVLDGRLAPGTDLDQEALSRELGLSTTPVREALRRLEAEGLVSQRAHFAIRIPELSRQDFGDIYFVRLRLEPEAARCACHNHEIFEQTCATLSSSLTAPAGTVSPVERQQINRNFHSAIYSASGNQTMTGILDSLWDRCDRYRVQLLKDDANAETNDQEHRNIFVAFCSQDEESLVRLVTEHVQASYDKLISSLS
jgi:DNA-binding GntR family transcriptional regulator